MPASTDHKVLFYVEYNSANKRSRSEIEEAAEVARRPDPDERLTFGYL